MLVIFRSNTEASDEQLRALPRQLFCTTSSGKAATGALTAAIVSCPETLNLVVDCGWPADSKELGEAGEFTEGLWESDVVELFLADRATGNYQEFHLAPNGAWWSATFSAPRVREERRFESKGVSVATSCNAAGWSGFLRLPKSIVFLDSLDASSCSGNLAAIINGHPKQYLSTSILPGEKVDFHQPRSFGDILEIDAFF